jgi:hypothetical protein
MRNFVTNKEAVAFTWGEVPELNITDKIVKAALGLRKFSAFRNLAFSVSKMNLLNRLYSQYPETPAGFSEWKKEVVAILSEVRARFR